jgi:hypothetical protein
MRRAKCQKGVGYARAGKAVMDVPTAAKKAPKKRKAKPAAKKADGRSKRGKYDEWLKEDGLLKIEAWARDGLTKEQIAHNMGCSLSTLKDWCNKYPTISAAISRGREVTDIIVENSLYKLANGYTVQLKKTFKLKKVTFNEETGRKISEEEYLKEGIEEVHIPANVQAQQFWLKNRKPEVWREKPSEHDGDGGRDTWDIVFDVDEEEDVDGEKTPDASASES